MGRFGIRITLLIQLFLYDVKGQSILGDRVTFSDNVIFGVQLPGNGSIRPVSGVVRTISTNHYSSFTHYQYGATIRTNKDTVDFISSNTTPDSGILEIKRNMSTSQGYGSNLSVRDRDDIGEMGFSSGFLHDGRVSLSISSNQTNSNLFFMNSTHTGKINIYINDYLIGTFNEIGFQYVQYTISQRDALQNLSPGTTIYNLTTGTNQTWSGTAWQ